MVDRWAILEAYHWFFVYYHGGQGSRSYQRLCRIQRWYRPHLLHTGYHDLSEPAREIFHKLEWLVLGSEDDGLWLV